MSTSRPCSPDSEKRPSKLAAGLAIEARAAAWLESRGHRILERNVRARVGELDLVAWDPRGRLLVFVEVRSRGSWESGVQSVGGIKSHRFRRMIEWYLWQRRERVARLGARGIRVDVLGWDGLDWDHRPGVELGR